MAEFSRKSGRRIIESIDTKKASKQQVFEFYQRQRKQLKSKGGKVGAALKIGASKGEIVRELQALELVQQSVRAAQKEEKLKQFTSKYESTKAAMEKSSVFEAKEQYKQFNKALKAAASRGDIDLKTFIGGAFKDIQKPKKKEQKKAKAKPEEKKPERRTSTYTSTRKRLPHSTSSFKGRLAKELVSKWVDDMLLDPDSFDDSDTIWAAMEIVDENPTDYQFFKDNYAGSEREGTQDYYEEFQAFLDIRPEFEADLIAEGVEIPPYPSQEYWDMLQEWRRSQNSSL